MKIHIKKYYLLHWLYAITNSVKPLYLINTINSCGEKNNGNIYLVLVLTDKRKYTIKKFEELRSKIRYLIKSITNSSKGSDEKYSNSIQMTIYLSKREKC